MTSGPKFPPGPREVALTVLHDDGGDLTTALYDDHVGPLAAPPLEQPGHEALHQGEAGRHDHGGVYLDPTPHISTLLVRVSTINGCSKISYAYRRYVAWCVPVCPAPPGSS